MTEDSSAAADRSAFTIVEDEPDMRLLVRLALTRDARFEPAIDAYLREDRIDQFLPTAQNLLGSYPAA